MEKRTTYKQIAGILSCLLLLICSGCIDQTLEPCEDEETCIRFNFLYNYNMLEADLFADQVDHITLFIYTAEGRLEETLEIYRQDMEENHTVSLMLTPGMHTAVAWGNCHTDHYRIYNQETTSGMQLEMACIENQVMTRANPGTLFHASNTFQVIPGDEYTVPMELVKNSNQVKVIIKGLTEEDRLEAESRFILRMSSKNWRYNYDNSINTEHPITYLPERNPEGDNSDDPDGVTVAFNFYPLRLFTYDTETVLTLLYRNPVTERQAALQKPLVPYLLNQPGKGISRSYDPDNEYLDREDTYEVTFLLGTDIDGNLIIKDWEGVNQGGEL